MLCFFGMTVMAFNFGEVVMQRRFLPQFSNLCFRWAIFFTTFVVLFDVTVVGLYFFILILLP